MKEKKEKWQEYIDIKPTKQIKTKITKENKKMEDNKKTVVEQEANNTNTKYMVGGILVILMIATNSKFVELVCSVLNRVSVYNWIIQVALALYVLAIISYRAYKNR